MRRPLPASAQPNSKSLLPSEQPIVTTSWDDGHPLDVRLAELLSSYGVPGTFYLPLMYSKIPLLGRPQMRAIRALGMEIGPSFFGQGPTSIKGGDRNTRRHAVLGGDQKEFFGSLKDHPAVPKNYMIPSLPKQGYGNGSRVGKPPHGV